LYTFESIGTILIVERYVVVQKNEGETPLQTLERYRGLHPELMDVPMTYAGRLDPMASGALIILIGEECKKRDAYTAIDKEYEFEVLFGVSTDTGDILGIIRDADVHTPDVASLSDVLRPDVYLLPYPAFSSKTVGGTPLFQYALDGTLDTIEIPQTEMTIRSVTFLGAQEMKAEDIRNDVIRRLAKVSEGAVNNFRKPDVLESWTHLPEGVYVKVRYRAVVSSGTYIRALAHKAGKSLGIPALAYTIHRTRFCGLG
jgi:tRNA pseudouridine(55) synthase